MDVKNLKVNRCRLVRKCFFFLSKNYQYMKQVASECRGGFLRQLLQETTGRLEQGYGIISNAYLHSLLVYKSCNLQLSCKLQDNRLSLIRNRRKKKKKKNKKINSNNK